MLVRFDFLLFLMFVFFCVTLFSDGFFLSGGKLCFLLIIFICLVILGWFFL